MKEAGIALLGKDPLKPACLTGLKRLQFISRDGSQRRYGFIEGFSWNQARENSGGFLKK